MRIPAIFIGIGVILVIAAIVLLIRNKKTEAFIVQRNGKCPRGTSVKYRKLKMGGKKTAVCVRNPNARETKLKTAARDKYLAMEFPYWGWGVHNGLRCKYNDNTGCNTAYRNGKLYMKYGN